MFDTHIYYIDYKWFKIRKRALRVVSETGEILYAGPWRWTRGAATDDMLSDSFSCVMDVFFEDREPPTI